MALQIADRIKESTTTTGTGALTLNGAATGYRAFTAVCSTNDTCYYVIEAVDANGVATGDWEAGLGTYSAANTLTRTTVNASSNAGSAVSLAAGTKFVWIDVTATHIGTYAPLASPTFTTTVLLPDGTAGSPGSQWASDNDGTGTGFYRRIANVVSVSTNGTGVFEFNAARAILISTGTVEWNSGAIGSGTDISIARTGANSLKFAATGVTTTSRTELNSAIASIADNVATAVLTITIPNAAHSASVRVRVTGSAGAGGAIGANEATAVNEYIVALTRTAGVNAVATISAAYGAAAATVAGANAVTCVAAMSAVSGAVGASNTFTVNATIARAAGTATNHTCLVYAQLMNANVTGITMA